MFRGRDFNKSVGETIEKPTKPSRLYCADCKWMIRFKTTDEFFLCAHPDHLNLVTKEPYLSCSQMRFGGIASTLGKCGEEARLFEEASPLKDDF